MFEIPRSRALLRRVGVRLQLAAFVRRFCLAFLGGCAVYAAAVLISKLGGVFIGALTPVSLLAIPSAAVLIAAVWHHRPSAVEAARAVDSHHGTKDLFLTVALIEKSAGEFQPLVARAAEERAGRVAARTVAPFRFGRLLGYSALAILAAALLLRLPQFDPFGKVEAAQQAHDRQRDLEESNKETEKKIAALTKSDENEGPLSEQTEKALEGLKKALNKMKPAERNDNLTELSGRQKQVGDMWRKLNAEKLKDLLSQNPQAPELGAMDREKLEKWTRELREGSTKSLQNELDELKDELKELAKTDDPVKKSELEHKIKKRMKQLSEFAGEKVNSKPLAAALQRAMKQLEMSKMDGLDNKQACEACQKSLELTKLELKEIAQSAKDLKALEEALKVIQMAKQLNEQEKLDGDQSEGMESIEEYAELYARLMAELGINGSEGDEDGEGDEGMGGEGMGRGVKAPEDDSVETGFKSEQSKSAVTAGKVLLSIKTKGLSDRGDAQKEYRDRIEQVKQGYREAILQEQIPPGYHDGIKTYFNNLEKSSDDK